MNRRDFLKLALGTIAVGATVGLKSPVYAAGNPPVVLCLGWDAMDYRSATQLLNAGQLPNLGQLNLHRLLAWPGNTVTKPGWAEIETGLPIPVTGIIDNTIYNSKILGGWTIYGLLRKAYPNCWLSTIHSKIAHTGDRIVNNQKEPFYFLKKWALGGGMDRYVSPSTLKLTAGLTIAQTHGFLLEHINSYLQSGKTGGLIFAHFKEPDEFGHLYGMGSSQWNDSVVQLDQILGEAVALLNPGSIFVISDHGFNAFGLKSHSNAPLGIIASNVPLKDDGIRCDFPPTLLALTGITPDGSTPALYGKSLLL